LFAAGNSRAIGDWMLGINGTRLYTKKFAPAKMTLSVGKGGSLVKVTTFEVKTDVYCLPHSDTNNLFVEFECRGKDSGINVTEADYYINYYPYLREAWVIKTSKLKNLINDNDFEVKEFSGDVDSNTKGYIIPRYQFKKHFKVKPIKNKWID
jgi:hypothetical protein